MTLFKCFSFTTILLILFIGIIIDAAPNPNPLDELTLNINIQEPNGPNEPDGSRSLPLSGNDTGWGRCCGVKGPKTKTFGENEDVHENDAHMNEYPWIVHLKVFFKDGPLKYMSCGGTLIASQWILTAHRCLHKNFIISQVQVTLEDHIRNKKGESEKETVVSTQWFFHHELHHERDNKIDLGLLKLEQPVNLDVHTPICLPDDQDTSEKYIRKDLWVYGWGQRDGMHGGVDKLQEEKIQVIRNYKCTEIFQTYGYDHYIQPSQMCTAPWGSSKGDSCIGNSGEPLSYQDQNGHHKQIGIVSSGWTGVLPPGSTACTPASSTSRIGLSQQ